MDMDGNTLIAVTADYGTLRDELTRVTAQKKALAAKMATLEHLDDVELDEARRQLASLWDKTHCIGWYSVALDIPLVVLAILQIIGGFFLCLSSIMGALSWTMSCSVLLGLAWATIGVIGLANLPVCRLSGPCGSCRPCSCSMK